MEIIAVYTKLYTVSKIYFNLLRFFCIRISDPTNLYDLYSPNSLETILFEYAPSKSLKDKFEEIIVGRLCKSRELTILNNSDWVTIVLNSVPKSSIIKSAH